MTSWEATRTSQPSSAIRWGDGRGQLSCARASPGRLVELRSRPHARISDAAGQGGPEKKHCQHLPGDAEAGPWTTLVTSCQGHMLTESREVPVRVINVCVLSHVQPLAMLWTVCHAPLSVGFPRKECMPGPSPRDLPDLGIEPESLTSPELAGGLFTTSATWEAQWEASINPLKFALCASFGAEDGKRAVVRVRAHRVDVQLCCCP